MNRNRALRIGMIAGPLLASVACGDFESACTESRTCSKGSPDASDPRGISQPDGGAAEMPAQGLDGGAPSLDGSPANGNPTAMGAGGPDGGGAPTAPESDAGPAGANGSACSDNSSCQSGHCSDRVCCNADCTERFFSCSVAGKEGTCSALTEVYVDPLTGNDGASGHVDHPLKTLGAALSAAKSGWVIHLEPGTYDASSGESFNADVPDGVAISAVVEGNAILAGTAADDALHFAGGGDVKGIVFENFAHALTASAGNLSIERSTIDGGGGLGLTGNAQATLDGVVFRNLDDDALSTSGIARVTMTGGSIGGVGYVPNCRGASAIHATDSSMLALTDVTIHDFGGDGVCLLRAASATLTRGVVTKTGPTDCAGAQIVASESSTLELDGTSLRDGNSDGLWIMDDARGKVRDGEIGVHPGDGLLCMGDYLSVEGGKIQSGILGIVLAGTCSALFDGTTIEGNQVGVELEAGSLKMRNSLVYDVDFAIDAPTGESVFIDLGNAKDPGLNVLTGAKQVLSLFGTYASDITFEVVGNVWTPDVQGAGHDGKYAAQLISGPANGRNFNVRASNVHLQL